MSRLVASLSTACKSTHCVEAGGGRGHLLVALSLAYHLPSLTIDCDERTLASARKRVNIIQTRENSEIINSQNAPAGDRCRDLPLETTAFTAALKKVVIKPVFVVGFFLDQDAFGTLVALVLSLRNLTHYRVVLMYASKVPPMGLLE
ncbi:jg24592 [Pararge aegeria aegeria]|uniref:Jg24592 protein n=1 Tax=Pararge aegeria aegeria TaxID=348720 RepID=A0A8S4QPB7_9NEOP|nr:jg24592 [Pararge aegeria aegeria]